MKKLMFAVLAVFMAQVSAQAQIDYLGNHLESMRYDNLRRHQQEMLSPNKKSRKRKASRRSYRSNRTHYKSGSVAKKEQNVSASRLRVGDAISAIRFSKGNLVFKGDAAKVVSRSPLTLHLNGKVAQPLPNGKKSPMGDFAIVTSTGRRSGVIGVMRLTKPDSVKFTRVNT